MLGQLIARFRSQEKAERRREERSTALYLLTRELADATHIDQILQKLVQQISDTFQARAAVLLASPGGALGRPHPASNHVVSEKEYSVAVWVLANGKTAGRFTDNLPLTTAHDVIGVLGIWLSQSAPPTLDQRNLLDAFVRQAALVIDRARLQQQAEHARLAAESERLGKTLLDSISHEMRTPLAAILSASCQLRESVQLPAGAACSSIPALLDEVDIAARRLNRLVGNLLDITRLESGHLKPKLDWADWRDVINAALQELGEGDWVKTHSARRSPRWAAPLSRGGEREVRNGCVFR